MDKNYYCNGKWFKSYDKASFYSDIMLELEGTYHVIYTRAEIESQIDHEKECGK